MSKKLSQQSKGVVHHSPGRTRLKVPKSHRQHIDQIQESLAGAEGVQSVVVNHRTGSITVKHEHDMPIFEALHKAAETVGSELLTTLIEGESLQAVAGVGLMTAGVGLIVQVGKAIWTSGEQEGNGNGKVKLPALTGQASDLKTVIPTAFLLAALYKAYETKMFWQGITPLALAYFAFDTYWKFNVSNPTILEPKNGHQIHENS